MWMVGVNDGSRVVTTRASPARGSRGTLFSSVKLLLKVPCTFAPPPHVFPRPRLTLNHGSYSTSM